MLLAGRVCYSKKGRRLLIIAGGALLVSRQGAIAEKAGAVRYWLAGEGR